MHRAPTPTRREGPTTQLERQDWFTRNHQGRVKGQKCVEQRAQRKLRATAAREAFRE